MRNTTAAATAGRHSAIGLGVLALAAAGAVMVPVEARAASGPVEDVTLSWSISAEAGAGAYFGGCNFLSAGLAGDTGSSRTWTEADGFYATAAGNVTVRKPAATAGEFTTPTWATKCQDATGATVRTTPGSSSFNEVVLAEGVGTVDPATGEAEVSWEGSFTVVFYGGMTYWSATDPTLTVAADGTGTLTATGSGWGAAMDDPSKWEELAPETIELATFTDVELGAGGFSATPDYLGVETTSAAGSPQVRSGDSWGSFPQSFVDFHDGTGQSSYWYSSGGAADVKKPATPVQVAWTLDDGPVTEPEPEPTPGEGEVPVDVVVPEVDGPDPEPEPGAFSWSVPAGARASLGTASAGGDAFTAAGALPQITVTDTRSGAPAWSIAGRATDFTGPAGSFGADGLGWTPSLSGNTVGAVAGPAVGAGTGLAQSTVLASAPSGHADGSVSVGADLELRVPVETAAGSYTSTLTLTALS